MMNYFTDKSMQAYDDLKAGRIKQNVKVNRSIIEVYQDGFSAGFERGFKLATENNKDNRYAKM